MGVVYLAVAQGPARFSKLHVVKELKPELVEDQTFLEMFLEEARLAARLNHPNIVQTYEIGSDGNRHYIVMDYLDGVTLDRVLRRGPSSFTAAMHLRVISEILEGLHYAHTLKDFDGTPLGIVHRDISPQNIFMTYDGQAKLVDFGIAKAVDSTVVTRTGVLKGKVAYMAPEQIGGKSDARADVFAAGVMIWEAAAHRRMWQNMSDVDVLDSVLKGQQPSLKELAPDTPPGLMAICEKATAREPNDRYQTAAELREALEMFLDSAPQRPSLKDAANLIAASFESSRVRTRALIEAHLQKIKDDVLPARVMTLPPESLMPHTSNRIAVSPSSHARHEELSSSERVSASSNMTRTGALPSGAEVPADFDGAGPTRLVVADRRVAKKRVGALVGLVAALALLVVVLGLKYGGHHDAVPAATVESPAASSERPALATPTMALVPEGVASANKQLGAAGSASRPPRVIPSFAAAATKPAAMSLSVAPPPPARVPAAPPAVVNHPNIGAASRRGTADNPGPASPAAGRATGFLTIDTYPWTRVSEGGRLLGDTPLIRLPLTPGPHTLSLENAGENVHQTTVVTVKAGETTSRRLAF